MERRTFSMRKTTKKKTTRKRRLLLLGRRDTTKGVMLRLFFLVVVYVFLGVFVDATTRRADIIDGIDETTPPRPTKATTSITTTFGTISDGT